MPYHVIGYKYWRIKMAQKILVSHEVRTNAAGDVTGIAFRKHSERGTIHDVVHEYLHREDGFPMVRCATGDTWKCKPVNHAEYDYVTVG